MYVIAVNMVHVLVHRKHICYRLVQQFNEHICLCIVICFAGAGATQFKGFLSFVVNTVPMSVMTIVGAPWLCKLLTTNFANSSTVPHRRAFVSQ